MVTKRDIQQLLQRESSGTPILSLYLDMSVGSDNKRSYHLFLNKQRSAFAELEGNRSRQPAAAPEEVFARIDAWLESEYDERNRGVAIFAEAGGDFFQAFQVPRPLQNRLVVQDRPAVAALSELLEHERRWGIVVVDREHMQLVATFMDQVEEEQLVAPDVAPTKHDIQAGGYAQTNIQRRKAEEVRHFYREFAEEIGRFQQRRQPHGYALLGTSENVKHFLEFLPQPLRERVVYAGPGPSHTAATELVQQLAPIFRQETEREEAEAVNALLERVRQSHFATAGFHDTLVQLQEGKVDTLIISRGAERDGVQCTRCGFTLVQRDGTCPYCGGELRDGIDLVESMIRMAAQQDARVEFVSAGPMDAMRGVGALLRF